VKRISLILVYVLLFTIASLVICQLPSFIKGEILFEDRNELILCIIAGVASGLIVGFFSTEEKKDQE
jgi:hypothetical protein